MYLLKSKLFSLNCSLSLTIYVELLISSHTILHFGFMGILNLSGFDGHKLFLFSFVGFNVFFPVFLYCGAGFVYGFELLSVLELIKLALFGIVTGLTGVFFWNV